MPPETAKVHEISVVIPVYRGEKSLPGVVSQLFEFVTERTTPAGIPYRVSEILPVYDNGPDKSDQAIRDLSTQFAPVVRPVWLSRNFGQHAAVAAGISSSGGHWVVTMDEDGQQNPAEIGRLLDVAISGRNYLVYGLNGQHTPHPWWRNATSAMAKFLANAVGGSPLRKFSSFRLIEGHRARSACAYMGSRTFLDIALSWTIDRVGLVDVVPSTETRENSGYRLSSLMSHFWTLVLSSGTRPLRIVSSFGVLAFVSGSLGAVFISWKRLVHGYTVDGWASVFVAVVILSGAILVALGVIAEYVGALLRVVQGRPTFVIGDDPALGPLPPSQ
jgi:polyisoprenyl-phosphate glycosyltransferase